MDREQRERELARRRRARARRNRRIGLAILVLLAAAGLILAAVLKHREAEPPVSAATEGQAQAAAWTGPQTDAPQTEPEDTQAPQTEPEETEAPQTGPEDTEPLQTEPEPPETEPEPSGDEGWKLILVNATHPLPEGYSVRLKELRNGHQVDERIYPELQQMFDDARAVGIHPFINESYRTTARQQQILDQYIANNLAAGMDRETAEAEARKIVALPGTSEHELGLALDIIAEFDADSTATWSWLKENSWRYGFILRYPADKEEITGISYEPWHFRYVGAEAAKEITEQGLCLEEYLAEQDH